MSSSAVPKGSVVLITGVTGFIASHVAKEFLYYGYKVKGTSRSLERGEAIKKYFHNQYGEDEFELVEVKDFASPGAFDSVMEGCAGAVHVASDLSFGSDPSKVITNVVQGTNNVLQAAAKHATVKHVVYTSSSSAVLTPSPEKTFSFGPELWNEDAIDYAWGRKTPSDPERMGFYVYSASKAEGERAGWDYIKQHKPHFAFTSICPNFVAGDILIPEQGGSSAGMMKGIYYSDEKSIGLLKMVGSQHHVDVRDVARLHVAPFVFEDAVGKRLFGFCEPISYNKLLEAFEKIAPKDHKLPPRDENEWTDKTKPDKSFSEEILRRMGQPGFTPLEDSLKRLIGTTPWADPYKNLVI